MNLDSYNEWRRGQGLAPLAPRSTKRPRMFQLSDASYEGLKTLATRLGYTYWGGANVTAMLEALGADILAVEFRKE